MTAPLDGNSLAGVMLTLAGSDVTTAICQCDGCATVMPMAQVVLYVEAPGTVARCPGCDHVLVRITQSAERSWLDLRGVRYLEVAHAV
jgi:Family of unknown function (DUF6510)